MAIIFSDIFFVLLCFIAFYLPGKWVVRKIGYKDLNNVSSIALSLGIGTALFLLINYVLSWLHIPYVYFLIFFLFIFLELPPTIKDIRQNFSLRFLLTFETLIILLGCILMVSITAGSGIEKNSNLIFYGVNALDGIYHSALIGNLTFQFPPSFPGLSGTFLRGYHFFYDFMVSRFAVFFGFNTFDLYFRFFSIFTAFFYGICGLALSYKLGMKRVTRNVFLFLLFFAQGGEFFIFHWFHRADILYDSGIVQPAGNIVDPSVLFSMSFVFLLYITLFVNKKKSHLFAPIFFLGILPGVKIYTAILVYVAVFVLAISKLTRKNLSLFSVLIPAGIISLAIYAPFNLGAGSLLFNPFLFYRHFMESDRVLSLFQWILKLQVYEAHRNIPRIIYMYALAVFFYFIPPLGIRLISLLQVRHLFSKSFYTEGNIFWFGFIFVGILIPTFFIQSISAFNIVQFFWLVWIALLIPTAYTLGWIIRKPNKWNVGLLFGSLIVLSFTVVKVPLGIYQIPPFIVSQNQLTIAKDIHSLSHGNTILVVNRLRENGISKDIYFVPLFGAIAMRPMYYEPEAADFSQSQKTESLRKVVVDEVVELLAMCPANVDQKLVSIFHIQHIQHMLLLQSYPCAGQLHDFKLVSQEDGISLFTLH